MFRSSDPVNPEMLVLARELRGLTLEQVAEQSGIALDVLQGYEANGGVLPINDIYTLARGYGVPIPFFQQEGQVHKTAHICYAHDLADELLTPLQALLDEIVGDDRIANVEWLEDGIYQCHYYSDEDRTPYGAVRLGSTLLQAENQLRRALKQAGG